MAAGAWAQADVRVRRFSNLTQAQDADAKKLRAKYHNIFMVVGMARRCGLDWQPVYERLVDELEQRHGPDMERYGRHVPAGALPPVIDGGMHSGDANQQAHSLSNPSLRLTCENTPVELAALKLPPVPASLALAKGERVPPQPRRALGPNEIIVSPHSPMVRSFFDKPLPADLFELLVMHNTLLLSGHHEALLALDRHLQRMAIARLTATLFAPARTLDQVMEQEWASGGALRREREKLLQASLAPRFIEEAHEQSALPTDQFSELRRDGRGVWSQVRKRSGEAYRTYLVLAIENTSGQTISQFDAQVLIDRPGGKPFSIDCKATPFFERLDAARAARHVCFDEPRRVPASELVAALRDIETGSGQWRLRVTRINFSDPAVGLSPSGAFWLNADAGQEALKRARDAGCFARGGCLADIQFAYRYDPNLVVATICVVAGLFLGVMIAALARKRPYAAALAMSAVAGFGLIAGVVVAWQSNPFGAVFLAQVGGVGIVAFLVALWAALFVTQAIIGRSGAAPASD